MSDIKFIGLDVHKATTTAAVLDENGKLMSHAVLITQAG